MGLFNNRLLFEFGSSIYDFLTDQDIWREQIADAIEHVPDPDAVRRVLDLGCGPGVSSFVLAGRLRHAEVVGIDLANKMIARARRQHERNFETLDNVTFHVRDATETGFDDGTFDLAVGHSFLYLVPDRQAVLREVRRVLAPGGTLVLMEPNRRGRLREAAATDFGRRLSDAPFLDSARFRTSMFTWRLVSGDVGRLDPDQVVEWMLDAGFAEARTHPTLGGLGMHCVARVG